MHRAKTFLLRQVLYCFLNFFFFCHKHYWNYTSCRYHQHAPIKTHILLSVVLGWTCLNHFSASLSTFISFLCRSWEYKRVLHDTSCCKGVLFTVRSATEAASGLLLFTPTTAAPRQWLGKKKKKKERSSLGPAPHPPTHLYVKQGHHLCRFIILQTCIWHTVGPELQSFLSPRYLLGCRFCWCTVAHC